LSRILPPIVALGS